ncbi:Arylsulfatase A [Halogranum rubrum]|uniref:Arylsulfatase A n=1 Tax=Halogranum rubrum TaxID=553466 RepID=A0A1I4BAX9_9EURY|nr:Arylsulfatase A [Halogranum rubrum]
MTTRPNVVLLVLDTARADCVDTVQPAAVTPNIAAIAESGTAYTEAFSSAPWTMPSHASLFTGTYSSTHGAHAGHRRLGPDLITLPAAFADHGYETVAASNNAWISDAFGFGRGFETFYRGWQLVQSETDLGEVGLTNNGRALWLRLLHRLFDGNPLTNTLNAAYAKFRFSSRGDSGAARTTEWVQEWLQTRSQDRPFFLFGNYLEPHLEYQPPKSYAQQHLPDDVSYDEAMAIPQNPWRYLTNQLSLSERDFEILRGLYKAELSYLDSHIGALCETLRATDQWENTLFVIVGDHGENIGEHGLMDHQYGLFDTLLHVPLVITGGSFTNGGQRDQLVQLLDVVPTLLDETDLAAPALRDQLAGTSLPHPSEQGRTHVFAEYKAPQPTPETIEQRVGDPHDVMSTYDRALHAVRTTEHKLVRDSRGETELYDVTDGESELSCSNHPTTTAQLNSKLEQWQSSLDSAESATQVKPDENTAQILDALGYLQVDSDSK